MSVFTTVTPEQLQAWLAHYPLGALRDLKGIASGITNTNYFVTTEQGRYVLTLFEKNSADELPYFLDLMAHLADHGIPCPHPVANLHGRYLDALNSKPAALLFETDRYSLSDAFRYGLTMMVISWLVIILAGESWFRLLGITPNGVFGLF